MIGVFFTTRKVAAREDISVRVQGKVCTDWELWQSAEEVEHSMVYFNDMTPAEAMHVQIAYVPTFWYG